MPPEIETEVTTAAKISKPRSRARKILYYAAGLLIFIGIAVSVLLNSYPNAVIHYIVEPKLKELVEDRLGRRYSLDMKSITLTKNKDSLILTGVRIVDNGKTAAGSSDTSSKNFGLETPLDRLTTDTVMISGLDYWRLVFQQGLYSGTISIRSPKIYLRPGSLPKFKSNSQILPSFIPAVSSRIINVENAEVFFSEETPKTKDEGGEIKNKGNASNLPYGGVLVKKASVEIHDFYLDESAIEKSASSFFCKSATFHAEDITHLDSLGATDIRVATVNGNLTDSSMSVHSIEATKPVEEVRRVAIDHVEFSGLDWFDALAGHGLHGRSVSIISPKLYLEDIAEMNPHSNLHFAASDFIPLPTLLPNVSVGHVEISNAELCALLPKSKNVTSLKHISMSLNGVSIDTTTPFSNISTFFSQKAHFGIDGEIQISTALGTLHIGAVTGNEKSITASNLSVAPSIKGIKLVELNSVEISGLRIWRLLMRQGLFATSVKVNYPAVYLDSRLTTPVTCIDSVLCSDPLAFIRGIKEFPLPALLPTAHIGTIMVSGGSVHGIHVLDDPKNSAGPGDSIGGLRISLSKFKLDSNSWINKRGMLFSDAGSFSIGAVAQHTPGAIYRYSESGISGNLRSGTLTIDSIAMHPLISEDSFGAAFKYRTERIDFLVPKIYITGIDYQKLFSGSGVFANTISANNWKLNIYGDRRRPEAPRTTRDKFPEQFFQEIRTPIGVKHIAVQNGEIIFSESWPDDSLPGTITANHINADIGTVSNDRSRSDTISTPIEGDMKIMNAGLLKFSIEYPLMDPHLSIDLNGTLGSMDPSVFNEYLGRTEPFKVTGHIRSAVFHLDLKDSLMAGTLVPQYDSIQVTFFRWDRFPPGFVSFLANAFIMRTHNIPELDNPLHTAEISTVLNPDANQFWELWHPIRTGISSLVRIPEWVW